MQYYFLFVTKKKGGGRGLWEESGKTGVLDIQPPMKLNADMMGFRGPMQISVWFSLNENSLEGRCMCNDGPSADRKTGLLPA